LERGRSLTGVQYRNRKSRLRVSELQFFEAEVQHWIDGYVALEKRINKPLGRKFVDFGDKSHLNPVALALEVRREVGPRLDGDPIPSVVEVVEGFGIRIIENPTHLSIDGLAARYGQEHVVALNSSVPSDRSRLNAAHELGHVLYGDCERDDPASKALETRAFDFASHLLMPSSQLKEAFTGKSIVRLIQYKERFGISLAAMIYRAGKLGFITKPEERSLWIAFAERNWRVREPGHVRPDRATRFEQLIEEAIYDRRLSLKEVADLCGVRPQAIRERLEFAIGRLDVPEDEGTNTLPFPE
jgi:Zn-dependent peptidase ImmA (M78 family)